MKTALVLSGGAIKGAFEAGAIAVLLERGLKPDGIFGISTGALNGCFLVDRAGKQLQEKRSVDWPSIGRQLVQFWRKRVTQPSDLLEERWTGQVLVDVLFNRFRGLTNTDRLRAIIDREIKAENLLSAKEAGIYYACGAVDLWSGSIEYKDADEAQIIEFIYASTAVPIAMPYVEIKYGIWDKLAPLVDGGVRDVVPLRRVISKEYEAIYCVLCQAPNVAGLVFDPGHLMQYVDRVVDIVTNELVENDLRTIAQFKTLLNKLQPNVELSDDLRRLSGVPLPKIIRPQVPIDIDIMKFNSRDIDTMIQLGEEEARKMSFITR